MSGTGLAELPASIGALANLRVLDISGSDFTVSTGLPDSVTPSSR